jgi:SAM-dependent methyltransferase
MTTRRQLHCLICGCKSLDIKASLTGAELRRLWAALDNEIGEEAYGSITPDTAVNLHQCSSCGFRFYDPEFSGSAEFYEELMAKKTYPQGSPEFTHAIHFAARHGIRAVLDVGGGEGAFLDHARQAGLITAGVELNRHASEVAASKGHRMFNKQMEDISLDELDGGTEFLTLFQVVEHVSAPVDFVISASRLVKPGGYISIAVPSDRRALKLLENDPADWPPHHVSRWRVEDLKSLGERAGLELVEYGADAFYGATIPWACDLHDRFESALGRKTLNLPKPLVSAARFTYRALKMQYYMPFHGLSIRAVLRKKPD